MLGAWNFLQGSRAYEGARHLDRLPLLSQVQGQGTALEVEPPDLKFVPICDAAVPGSGFIHYATMLAPNMQFLKQMQ